MVDLTAIGGAVSAFKGLKDIAQAMVGIRDDAAFKEKLLEFQSKLLDANDAVFAAQDERSAMLEEIRTLKASVATFQAWDAEKARYELKAIKQGAFAYALKDGDDSEPAHYLCANCMNDGHKSILQEVHHAVGRAESLDCNRCGAQIYMRGQPSREHIRPGRRS